MASKNNTEVSLLILYNGMIIEQLRTLKLIDRKHQHFVFAFFMAFLMSCLMSFVISVFNVGFDKNILTIWLKAWGFAFAIAFPAVMLVSPIVRKLVNLVLKNEDVNI
jgi:hypothetical protein